MELIVQKLTSTIIKNRSGIFTNLKFVYGDNLKLKFKDNSSDITMSQGVIHHTLDMFKSLSELIRVTKKGGNILLLVYGEHGMRWSLIRYIEIS